MTARDPLTFAVEAAEAWLDEPEPTTYPGLQFGDPIVVDYLEGARATMLALLDELAATFPAEHSVTAGLCECGCGRTTKPHPSSNATLGYVRGEPRRFAGPGHSQRRGDALDQWSVAYRTGRIDHRRGHARRVDIADTSPIGRAYTTGYDHQAVA